MFQLSLKRNDKDTELAKSHLAGIRKGIFPGKVLFLLFSYSIRYTPPSFFTVLPVIFRKAHTTSSRDSSLPNSRLYTSTGNFRCHFYLNTIPCGKVESNPVEPRPPVFEIVCQPLYVIVRIHLFHLQLRFTGIGNGFAG